MARGKGEGAIYKREKDGLWYASIELPPGIDGKRRRKYICRKDKGSAVAELRKLQQELSLHGDLATNSMTLSRWMEQWRDDIAPKTVRPKTLEGYRTVVNGYIIPALGKKTLTKLTAQDVRRLHKIMANTPKNPKLRGQADLPEDTEMLSSTYILLAHNALSVALKAAVREGLMRINPCDMVDRPRKRVMQQQALDVDQAIHLLRHLVSRSDRALWATYLLTGARRGEILGLESDRVGDQLDLSWQLQRITDIASAPADYEYRALGGTLYLTRPKSRAGWRIIPLVEPLKSILKLHMQNRGPGLLFLENDKPWDPDRATKAWKKLLEEASLPTDVVLHGARHTVVDLLYEAGVPEAVIMEIVGQSTRSVLHGYRSRGNNRQLVDAMNKMSKLLRA